MGYQKHDVGVACESGGGPGRRRRVGDGGVSGRYLDGIIKGEQMSAFRFDATSKNR